MRQALVEISHHARPTHALALRRGAKIAWGLRRAALIFATSTLLALPSGGATADEAGAQPGPSGDAAAVASDTAPAETRHAAAPEYRRVLLLITVDTLRIDHVGLYGSQRALTPNIDALGASSLVYENAYTPTPLTLPAISSLMTGRYPQENGIVNNEVRLGEGIPTLAERLKDAGWSTGAVVSNYVLGAPSGLDRGFDVFDDEFDSKEVARQLPERNAPSTTDAALRVFQSLVKESNSIFLWVHYQDPHGPYTPPEALRKKFLEAELAKPDGKRALKVAKDHRGVGGIPSYQVVGDHRRVAYYRAGYAAEVFHTDQQIGRLLSEIRERAETDWIVTALAGDHGESLGEDDYWFAHGEHLFDSLIHIPLIVNAPWMEAGRPTALTSIGDLFNRLQLLASVPLPDATSTGGSLAWTRKKGWGGGSRTLLIDTLDGSSRPRTGILTPSYKLLVDHTGDSIARRVFELGDDRAGTIEVEAATLRNLLARYRKVREALQSRPSELKELGDSDLQLLRALGYIE